MSVNGGVHFVETRNNFGASETVEGTTTPLFPAASALGPTYGHKDHWRYYTLGLGFNPNSKFSFDLGWTRLDQDIKSATCMPLPTIAFGVASPLGTPTALNCANSPTVSGSTNWSTSFARALLLHYQEKTDSAYVNISYEPVKHVTLTVGYEITGDNGQHQLAAFRQRASRCKWWPTFRQSRLTSRPTCWGALPAHQQ